MKRIYCKVISGIAFQIEAQVNAFFDAFKDVNFAVVSVTQSESIVTTVKDYDPDDIIGHPSIEVNRYVTLTIIWADIGTIKLIPK